MMNKARAKEIAASPVMANVTYDGVPIYIQYVNDENDMARIYPLNEPENEHEVSVDQLQEHDEMG